MIKVDSFKESNSPFFYLKSTNFLPIEKARSISELFPKWESEIWTLYGKEFNTKNGYKKELVKREYFSKETREFLEQIESSEFIKYLEDKFNLNGLFVDKSIYGGGLNLYPPGKGLDPHIDFNFNDELKAYRSVNLLLYLSDDWNDKAGGELALYDKETNLVALVPPVLNTCVVFAPTNNTIHGVMQATNGFFRKSISIWYYTKTPQQDVDEDAHKTLWK